MYLLRTREGKLKPIKYTHLQTSFCLKIREVGGADLIESYYQKEDHEWSNLFLTTFFSFSAGISTKYS